MQFQLYHPLPGPHQHFTCLTGRRRHGVGHLSGFHIPSTGQPKRAGKSCFAKHCVCRRYVGRFSAS